MFYRMGTIRQRRLAEHYYPRIEQCRFWQDSTLRLNDSRRNIICHLQNNRHTKNRINHHICIKGRNRVNGCICAANEAVQNRSKKL